MFANYQLSEEEKYAMKNSMNLDERWIYFSFKFTGVMEVPCFKNLVQVSPHQQTWCRWIELGSLC